MKKIRGAVNVEYIILIVVGALAVVVGLGYLSNTMNDKHGQVGSNLRPDIGYTGGVLTATGGSGPYDLWKYDVGSGPIAQSNLQRAIEVANTVNPFAVSVAYAADGVLVEDNDADGVFEGLLEPGTYVVIDDADGTSSPEGDIVGRATVYMSTTTSLEPLAQETTTDWTGVHQVVASNKAGDDSQGFGYSVAVNGDTVVVAHPYYAYASAPGQDFLQVWRRQPSDSYTLEQEIPAPTNQVGFGYAVALSGDTMIVSEESGTNLYVYTRSGTTWALTQTINAGGTACAISLDGTLMAAATQGGVQGASVYRYNGTSWALEQNIPTTQSSYSIVIKAAENLLFMENDGIEIYTYNAGTWTAVTKVGSNAYFGNPEWGALLFDYNAGTLTIGSPFCGVRRGAVYVYTGSGATWTEQQRIEASDIADNDCFGYSVNVVGNELLVGNQNPTAGKAYLFTRTGSTWAESKIFVGGVVGYAYSADYDGRTAVIGAYGRDGGSGGADIYY